MALLELGVTVPWSILRLDLLYIGLCIRCLHNLHSLHIHQFIVCYQLKSKTFASILVSFWSERRVIGMAGNTFSANFDCKSSLENISGGWALLQKISTEEVTDLHVA